MAGLNTLPALNAIVSKVLQLGMFDKVNTHEPKSAPGKGLTCSIRLWSIGPARGQSGLAATSPRVEWVARIQENMLREPVDDIDSNMAMATDAIMEALSAGFQLDGTVRNVDLLGTYGEPLRAQAGYMEQDKVMFRIIDIFIPYLVNDAWSQGA
jgi:hypothetical protein